MSGASQVLVRMARTGDLLSMIENFQAVASEGIYLATETVTEDQKKRMEKLVIAGNGKSELSIVADIQGKVVGGLTLYKYGELSKTRHIRGLGGMLVIKEYRGQGIGSALMTYAVAWATKHPDIEKINLEVFSTDKQAIQLYQKFGFQFEGVRKKQFKIRGEYVDEVSMGLFVK